MAEMVEPVVKLGEGRRTAQVVLGRAGVLEYEVDAGRIRLKKEFRNSNQRVWQEPGVSKG